MTDRASSQRLRYAERKAGTECTRCSEPHTEDSPYCAAHLASEVERIRKAVAKLRADRRAGRRCIDCNKRSRRKRCRACHRRKRGGVTAKVQGVTQPKIPRPTWATDGARNQVRAITEADGRTRNRLVGRSRRGGIGNAANDELDVRLVQRELETAITALAYAHSPEVKAMPRIQARDILHAALARLNLAQRLLGEILARHKYLR